MKSRTFLAVPALAASIVLSSCSSPHDVTLEKRPVKTYNGEMKTFSSQSEAVSFLRSRIAQCDTSVVFKLRGGNAAAANQMAYSVNTGSELALVKAFSMGELMMFEIHYTDDVLLLRAAKDPDAAAALTPTQRKVFNDAKSLVSRVCSQYSSDYDRALALHDHLVLNAAYRSSSVAKNLASCTTSILYSGQGVCEGYTRAYRLLLTLAGIENRYVGGTAQNETHCWNMAKLGGQWVHIDCTYDDPLPDVVERAIHSYFGMSDAQIGTNHVWDRSLVPAATTTALYYPYKMGWRFATMQDFVNYAGSRTMPKGYLTIHIDELAQPGAKVSSLLGAAERKLGKQVVYKYSTADSLPTAFNCLCNF